MSTPTVTAKMTPVTPPDTDGLQDRGRAIAEHLAQREPGGLTLSRLLRRAEISEETYRRHVLNGTAHESTYLALEAALKHWDLQNGQRTLQERLEDLEDERARLKIPVARLAKAAGYGPQNWYDTLKGKRPIETVERFEEALRTLRDNPADIPDEPRHLVVGAAAEHMVEVELRGVLGIEQVFVRAPVGEPGAIKRAVEEAAEAIREFNRRPDQS